MEGVNMQSFDRSQMLYLPLSQRKNKVTITESAVDPLTDEVVIPPEIAAKTARIAEEILDARRRKRSVIVVFGAHAIKNGLGRLLAGFARRGWATHLATNGAGVIHDWEFAYQGASSEDVRANVQEGHFGTWEETGLSLNLGLAVGAWEGRGYGESIGAMDFHSMSRGKFCVLNSMPRPSSSSSFTRPTIVVPSALRKASR